MKTKDKENNVAFCLQIILSGITEEIKLYERNPNFVTPTFCRCFAFTGINFRGMLHHVCDVAYDENMCGPIRPCKCRSTN